MDEILNQTNSRIAMLPALVQHWMDWMGIIFIMSILFVWHKKATRFVLLALLLPIPVAFILFHFFHNIHLLGFGHLLFWIPLLWYLLKVEIKNPDFKLKSLYGIWLSLIIITASISVVFDARDIRNQITDFLLLRSVLKRLLVFTNYFYSVKYALTLIIR